MSGEPAPIKSTALRIFRGLSESYDSVLDYATLLQDRRWKEWVVAEAGLKNGSEVLDLGCGTCVLEERLPDHCRVIGVDITEEMLRRARGKPLQNVDSLLLSDGEKLPFRESCFHAVVSCYLVKYCDSRVLVSEMARVLKPGGSLVLYDFVVPRGALWPLNAIYIYGGLPVIGKLMQMCRADSARTFSELPGIISGRRWDAGFRKILSESGFSDVEEKQLPGGAAVGFRATKTSAPSAV